MSYQNNSQNNMGYMQGGRQPQSGQMPSNMQSPVTMSPMQSRFQSEPVPNRAIPISPLASSLPLTDAAAQLQDITHKIPPLSPYAGQLPSMQRNLSPLASSLPAGVPSEMTPVTVQSPYYTAGFMKNFIGKDMRVEFLMGTNGNLSDRTGTLLEVGASYIVLQPWMTDDLLMCDLYSIKFVTIYA